MNIIGPQFQGLCPTLQAYLSARPSRWRGDFLVHRGSNPWAKVVGWLLRMPPPGGVVDTRLRIELLPGGERWIRRFAGAEFVSDQSSQSEGVLVEKAGPLAFALRVEVSDGGVVFTGKRLHLHLGSLRIPVPSLLGPIIAGWIAAPGQGSTVYSHIRISHPWVGTLSEYSGTLIRVD